LDKTTGSRGSSLVSTWWMGAVAPTSSGLRQRGDTLDPYSPSLLRLPAGDPAAITSARAWVLAAAVPWSPRIRWRHRSIPVVTPADVRMSPSSANRRFGNTATFG